MAEVTYSEEHMPPDFEEAAKTYRKKVTTPAVRIVGAFTVETDEGPLRCQDGYLAVDSRGYPYPIATEEFEQIYDEVGAGASPPKFESGEWAPMPEQPNWTRHTALELAIKAAPGAGDIGLVDTAAKFEEYLRNGKEQKSE